MSKDNKAPKQPRTVEIKLLVPYAIITVMIVATASLIAGWTLRSNDIDRVHTEAKSLVTSLK